MRPLLGLVALALCLPAAAQTYRIERDFDLLRDHLGRPLRSLYQVSLPLVPWIDDVANSSSSNGDKCIEDVGGPASADGRIDSDDVICSWWQARANPATAGTFVLTSYDFAHCVKVTRVGTVALGGIRFTGQRFDLREGEGLEVMIAVSAGRPDSPHNHVVIEGDCDPAWTGLVIPRPPCADGYASLLLGVPYDAPETNALEILCGLRGVDWDDANGDGRPDRCWDDRDGDGVYDTGEALTGIFDARAPMVVSTFDNSEQVNASVACVATIALGRLRFTGTFFDLHPGEAYLATPGTNHHGSLWDPPNHCPQQ